MITLALLAALAAGSPAPANGSTRDCLYAGRGDAHYTAVDDRTIVVASGRRAWRLTVSPTSQLRDPASVLVNEVRGPPLLCRPIDFQLSVVTQPIGFRTGLIAQGFEPITAAQAKVLLKRR